MCSLVHKYPEIWKNFDKLGWDTWGTHEIFGGFQKSWYKIQKFLQIFFSEALVLIDAWSKDKVQMEKNPWSFQLERVWKNPQNC